MTIQIPRILLMMMMIVAQVVAVGVAALLEDGQMTTIMITKK